MLPGYGRALLGTVGCIAGVWWDVLPRYDEARYLDTVGCVARVWWNTVEHIEGCSGTHHMYAQVVRALKSSSEFLIAQPKKQHMQIGGWNGCIKEKVTHTCLSTNYVSKMSTQMYGHWCVLLGLLFFMLNFSLKRLII